MNIIYLHQYFMTPQMSGGTRSYEMAKRMVEAGHTVHMVTSRTDGRLKGGRWFHEKIDGIDVHWLPVEYNNAMSYGRRILSFTQFARKAGQYAAKLKGDVVFATSTPLTIAIPGVYASRRLKVPMVFEVRDLWPELPIAMGALDFPFAKWLARGLEKWAYKRSQEIIALSPGMVEGVAYAGVPRQRIHCIPNGCDLELFLSSPSSAAKFREARDWLGDRKLVVYAGTLGKINGVSFLVDLAAEMRELDPEVRFLIVGAGAEEEKVREDARSRGVLGDNLFMEAAMPKSEVPALLSAATVCCSLFIPLVPMWNNSANKFFDALAAEKPVLINYGGWQADLLSETGAGISVPPGDASTAAKQLAAFLADQQALEVAREASGRLARTKFSRDLLANRLIGVLEEVVG